MSGKWLVPESPAVRNKLAESLIVFLVLVTAAVAYWFFFS
jgi:hypothetical protein